MVKPVHATLFVLILLAGCADMQTGPKTAGGTLIGAGAGGLVGSQFGSGTGKVAMTGLGVLLGAIMGSEVGRTLDRADQLAMGTATQGALETMRTGQMSQWRNPDTGNYGTVMPLQTMQRADGQYCREYQQTVTVGGRTEQAYGTACRQPDGSWKILS
jgi:surface antigen